MHSDGLDAQYINVAKLEYMHFGVLKVRIQIVIGQQGFHRLIGQNVLNACEFGRFVCDTSKLDRLTEISIHVKRNGARGILNEQK